MQMYKLSSALDQDTEREIRMLFTTGYLQSMMEVLID